MSPPSVRALQVTRIDGPARTVATDEVIVEEPLAIRVGSETLAVTMRTPGHDRELALGFLFAEGVIASVDDVGAVAHCGRTGDESRGNTIEVTPAPGARLRLPDEAFHRGTLTTSACGVCGRRSIDDLLARCGPVRGAGALDAGVLRSAFEALRETQRLFARTGGCHGASLVTFEGEHVATFEDVGRHNAVDKLVGSRLLARALPLDGHVLAVSGRTSFEIVQKAAVAGIPVVAGISAASSLAVDVARRTGITLVGFARGDSCVVYAGDERLRLEER